jgi:hypothetical protein
MFRLSSIKEKIVDAAVSHPRAATIGASLAVGAGIVVAVDFANLGIQMVHASTGVCNSCASSFTPNALSSGLQGTGEHGVQKIFAPGQEALATGSSASNLAPGQLKP